VLLETRAAQHRPALSRLEGNCRFFAALRAVGPRFRTSPRAPVGALGLALLAALGVILELFIVKEKLFARGKDKLIAAVCALQDSVGKFHGRLP
jgi:hypothetical protein